MIPNCELVARAATSIHQPILLDETRMRSILGDEAGAKCSMPHLDALCSWGAYIENLEGTAP